MNVGGIAGYFGATDVNNEKKKDYRILNAINNGGDIMATGGIKKDGSFTKEKTHEEEYITGNIGGIAGYLYGAPVHIQAGGNRGDVHTAADTTKLTSQAVNVGGIVGKFDLPKITDSSGNVLTDDQRLEIIKGNGTDAAGKSGYASAVVSSSYNTGNVTGYTNIGGIGGLAYNGSIAAPIMLVISRLRAMMLTQTVLRQLIWAASWVKVQKGLWVALLFTIPITRVRLVTAATKHMDAMSVALSAVCVALSKKL